MAKQYIMKGLDADEWQAFKEKAVAQRSSLKDIIVSLLRQWLKPSNISQSLACEWGFRAAEKGWNLEQTMIEFRKLTDR